MTISGKPNSLILTAFATLCIFGLLVWQYLHDGVPSHYLMQRSDMPSISNWWGALIIPLITWISTNRMDLREGEYYSKPTMLGFLAALLYGLALSFAFSAESDDVFSMMLLGILLIALFHPNYKAECFLGIVFGLTYTFGAVLSLVFALVFGLMSFVIYRYIRPILYRLISVLARLFKVQ